ncbi:MAG: T9SS type A sorting domain-containing protein [Bacteroidota bacterium]
MKKYSLITCFLILFSTAILQAQNLDRVAISSGGISSDTLNATIGEIFVFNVNSSGINISSGSQNGTGNTGGMPTTINETKNSQPEILVYPNPVDDLLNLQINGMSTKTISFQVFNISGKLVLQYNSVGVNNLYQLHLRQLSPGNYFIQGYTTKGETIGKIKFIKL